MPQRQALRINVGPQDGALFSRHNLPWVPRAHVAFNDLVRQKFRLPINNPAPVPGSVVTIPFDKIGTILEDVCLRADLTMVPAGVATFARFVDWVGLLLVRRVRWRYAQNQLVEYQPDDAYWKTRRECHATNRNMREFMVKGNRTAAQRNADALGPVTILAPLCRYWEGVKGFSPLIAALSNRLTLQLEFARNADLIQSDSAASVYTIGTPVIEEQIIHLVGEDRAALTANTLKPQGINMLFADPQRAQFAVPVGTVQFTQALNNFNMPCWEMAFFLRRTAFLTTDFDHREYENMALPWFRSGALLFNDSDAIQLELRVTGDNEFIIPINNTIDSCYNLCKFYNQDIFGDIMVINFAELPLLKNCASQSYNLANITGLEVRINFIDATLVPLTLDVIAWCHNWINQQGGELQRIWN